MSGEITQPVAIAILVPLFALGFYGLLALFMRRHNPDQSKVNWTPAESIGVTVALFFLTQFLGGLLIAAVLGIMYGGEAKVEELLTTSVGTQFGFVLVVESLTAAAILWFARHRQTPLRLIGLVRPKLRDIGVLLSGFVVYFAIYVLFVLLVNALVPSIDWEQRQELGFSTDSSGFALGMIFVSLVLLPPLVEELLVRGLLYSGLRSRLKFVPAAIITSLLFAAAHLQAGSGNSLLWVAALDTFTLSLVLVYMREKTGSLWPGIGLHMLKNLIAFMALFVFHSA